MPSAPAQPPGPGRKLPSLEFGPKSHFWSFLAFFPHSLTDFSWEQFLNHLQTNPHLRVPFWETQPTSSTCSVPGPLNKTHLGLSRSSGSGGETDASTDHFSTMCEGAIRDAGRMKIRSRVLPPFEGGGEGFVQKVTFRLVLKG